MDTVGRSQHLRALAQALLVTFLWSTSWVLIKIGLRDIPPLTFAGLRYVLAFACLLAFMLWGGRAAEVRSLTSRQWALLAGFGLLQYAVTQGAQFVSLAYLPATTASLVLAFTPALVALLSGLLLRERLGPAEWLGVALFAAGALVYFGPSLPEGAQRLGLIAALVGLFANAGQGLLGRYINRSADIRASVITTVSMGVGAAALLTTGVFVQGFPALDLRSWLIVVWLAVVNTAAAFTLWNHTQRTLGATESSLINNTMLVQIAVLAFVFLGDRLTLFEVAGVALAVAGLLAVQLPKLRRR